MLYGVTQPFKHGVSDDMHIRGHFPPYRETGAGQSGPVISALCLTSAVPGTSQQRLLSPLVGPGQGHEGPQARPQDSAFPERHQQLPEPPGLKDRKFPSVQKLTL